MFKKVKNKRNRKKRKGKDKLEEKDRIKKRTGEKENESTWLFKTSSDLSTFVRHELTGLFKARLDLSSICLNLRQVLTCLDLYDANWQEFKDKFKLI